jgi:hypothetical protein
MIFQNTPNTEAPSQPKSNIFTPKANHRRSIRPK